MTDIVKIYNPANAAGLTQEQTEGLQKLTSDQIKTLAKAYPNTAFNKAYLLIIDSTKQTGKQIPNLSTFENLYNLREKNGRRNYVAYGFQGANKPRALPSVGRTRKTEVVDLSDVELMSLPGFKTANVEIPPTQVPVRKITKEVAEITAEPTPKKVTKPKKVKNA